MPEEEVIVPDAAETPAEPEAAPETATTEGEQEQKPKGGFQRKIDKLTRERYELREQLAEMRGRLAVQPAAATQTKAEDAKPDSTKWTGTWDEYVAALSRWEARQEYKELSKKERETAEASEREERDREVISSYRERTVDFSKEHDDFNEVVARAKLANDIAGPVQVAIMEDDHGPELAYYLGEHPEVCDHLSDMTAAGAVKYLGRLSERLFPEVSGEEEEEEVPAVAPSKPKPARQAPAPIKPVRKPSPAATGLSDDLPIEEWVKRREAQTRKA